MRPLFLLAALALAACESTPTETATDPAPTAVAPSAAAPAADRPADAPPPDEMEATVPTALVSDAMPETAPERLASGAFRGASGHDVAGDAILYRLDNGSHLVRLEGLDSDNGPDLEVWLVRRTSGDVGEGAVSLGDLKSVRGDQNYDVPAGTDVSEFAGVSVWCVRFGINFGVAPLTPTASR